MQDFLARLPDDNAACMISALDQLVQVVAEANSAQRNCLATCQMCRNRLLYLLDTAPYAGSAIHQFGRRIADLPDTHLISHQNPAARDHGDSRRPQIRGLA